MQEFEIRNRFNGQIIVSGEAETLAELIQVKIREGVSFYCANLSGANLRGANLREANLREANLREADLRGAYLRGADLSGADLSGAYLREAYLREANLSGANLREANLSGAYLREADLSGADLSGAYLREANLREANLRGARLIPIRDDLWAVLSATPKEVEGLRQALIEGRIDGTAYQGCCACLVGTIANVRGVHYETIPTLRPDSRRPAERFFLGIAKGDTPETNQISNQALSWIDEWLTNMREAFGSGATPQGPEIPDNA
jgi:uncharacterized protein YjbI with pentapeptide repeats